MRQFRQVGGGASRGCITQDKRKGQKFVAPACYAGIIFSRIEPEYRTPWTQFDLFASAKEAIYQIGTAIMVDIL